jgi:hypothetical protein
MTAAATKQKSKGPLVIKASLVWYNKVSQGKTGFKAESGNLKSGIPPIHRSLGKSSHHPQI